jgi:hypothetical protein
MGNNFAPGALVWMGIGRPTGCDVEAGKALRWDARNHVLI